MKARVWICLLLICGGSIRLLTAQVVDSDSLRFYEGKTVRACDDVKGVFSKQKNSPIFINFGKPFPNQKFVGVIFAKDLPSFSYNPQTFLINKYICLEGKVKMYKGKPEIILYHPSQIILPKKELLKK